MDDKNKPPFEISKQCTTRSRKKEACLLFGPMPCAREGIEGVRRIGTFEKVSIALGEYYVPDRRTK